jgi:hypothetical protein
VLKDLAGLTFTRDQFDLLLSYCTTDKNFPRSWEAWNQLVQRADEEVYAHGRPREALSLDPAHFQHWCIRLNLTPCLDALRAYAIIHRSPAASSKYGAISLDSRPIDLE